MEAGGGCLPTLSRSSLTCQSCSRQIIVEDDLPQPQCEDVFREGDALELTLRPSGRTDSREAPAGSGRDFDAIQLPADKASDGDESCPHPGHLRGQSDSASAADTDEPLDERIKRLARQAAEPDSLARGHPVCCKCLDAAIAELEPTSKHEKRLIRKYERALKRLQRSSRQAEDQHHLPQAAADEMNSAVLEIQELDKEEKQLLQEIALLEASTTSKEKEQLQVVAELAELHMWHIEFWLLFSGHSLQAAQHEERKRAMERLFAYVSQELQRLKRTNVVNDAFHIWTSKFLPSINHCRIGRISSPSCPTWAEVNTGWGYLCLLLDVFYRKCHSQPSNYRLVPRGQFSFLVRKKDEVVLPLHGGGGEVGLSRFFYSNKRFDAAMISFLECVKELFDRLVKSALDKNKQGRVRSLLPIPELPYVIDGDKVGGFSIRLQLNQDERWTRALKHLLIDMKWLLDYIERGRTNKQTLAFAARLVPSSSFLNWFQCW